MTISQSEQIAVKCTSCGKPQTVTAWVLVDVDERPDLADAIRDMSFHTFTCTNCHQRSSYVETIMVFRSDLLPNILYSLNPHDDKERTSEKATISRLMLQKRLGPVYKEEMASKTFLVPYPILHLAIDRDLEADMQDVPIDTLECTDEEMIAYQDMLGNVRLFRDPESIKKSGAAFMGAPTWNACLAILKKSPELLTQESVQLLEIIVKLTKEDRSHPDMVKTAIERKKLIERCREVGVSTAIREKQKELTKRRP
jgi:CpXC motif protein